MNRDALMLRSDVVEAIDAGRFHVYVVSTVEEGIELLTGAEAGGLTGNAFPEGSIFARVEATLKRFYEVISRIPR